MRTIALAESIYSTHGYFNVLVSKEEEKLTRNKSADVVLNSTHDTLPRPVQRLNRLC